MLTKKRSGTLLLLCDAADACGASCSLVAPAPGGPAGRGDPWIWRVLEAQIAPILTPRGAIFGVKMADFGPILTPNLAQK